jgi:hypothetical protein
MRKNIASQIVGAQLVSASDGSVFTGSVTCHVTGDGGTQATGSVGSGACTHEGNGFHTYTPAQAETNYNHVAFTFVGTGAVPVTVQVYTHPTTGVLAPTVADRTLDVTSNGNAGIDWANIDNATTSVALSSTTVSTAQQIGSVSGAVGSISGVTFPTNFADLAITSSTGRVTVGTNNDKTGYSISGTLTTLDDLDTAQDAQHATTQSSLSDTYDLVDSTYLYAELAAQTAASILVRVPSALVDGRMVCDVTAISGDSVAADNLEAACDGTGYNIGNGSITVTAASIRSAVGMASANLDSQLATIDDFLDTEVATLTSELAKVPKSDGTASWNATALAAINTQCDTALADYDAPTNAEMTARTLASASYATVANQTTIIDYIDTEVAAIKTKTDLLPSVAAGSNGGLPTVDASNRIAGIQGTITTLDALDTAQDAQHTTSQSSLSNIYVDTQSITSRLPAALVSGRMSCDVIAVSGDTIAADNLERACDGSGYNVGNGAIVPYIDAAVIRSALGMTTANLDYQLLILNTFADDNDAKTDEMVTAIAALPDAADVADAVWNENRTGHTTAGTFGSYLDMKISEVEGSGGGGTGGPVEQRFVASTFTVTLPTRQSSTPATDQIVHIKSSEVVLVAIDFSSLLASGDRVSTIDNLTTSNVAAITFEEAGVDRTLAKFTISGATAGETYPIVMWITSVYGDVLEGNFTLEVAA